MAVPFCFSLDKARSPGGDLFSCCFNEVSRHSRSQKTNSALTDKRSSAATPERMKGGESHVHRLRILDWWYRVCNRRRSLRGSRGRRNRSSRITSPSWRSGLPKPSPSYYHISYRKSRRFYKWSILFRLKTIYFIMPVVSWSKQYSEKYYLGRRSIDYGAALGMEWQNKWSHRRKMLHIQHLQR